MITNSGSCRTATDRLYWLNKVRSLEPQVTALDFILSCMLITEHLAFLNIQLNPQELEELNAFIFQTELSLQKWEPVIKSRELDVLKGVFYASKAVFLMTTKPEEATFWAKESIKFLSSVKKLELIVSISLLCATTVCKVGGEMEAAQEGLALLDSFTLPFTKLPPRNILLQDSIRQYYNTTHQEEDSCDTILQSSDDSNLNSPPSDVSSDLVDGVPFDGEAKESVIANLTDLENLPGILEWDTSFL